VYCDDTRLASGFPINARLDGSGVEQRCHLVPKIGLETGSRAVDCSRRECSVSLSLSREAGDPSLFPQVDAKCIAIEDLHAKHTVNDGAELLF
jgi:hypothetical protein